MSLDASHTEISLLNMQNKTLRGLVSVLALTGTIGTLIAFVAGYFLGRVPSHYFATSPTGQITQIQPLTAPYLTPMAVKAFASQCTQRSYSLDFLNWRRQIESVSDCFTTSGFMGYQNALDESKNLKTIKENRMVQTVHETGPSVIVEHGIGKRGSYYWLIEVPVRIQYESESKRIAQDFLAQIEIERQPVETAPAAIGIHSVKLKPNA